MDWHVRIFVFIMWERYILHYYHFFFCHSLCRCSFCVSAGRKPCILTWSISHSSQSFCHKVSTFLRIRADPSMQIFWVSVRVALSDTFLMFSTIPLLLLFLLLLLLFIIIVIHKQVKNNAETNERCFGVILTPFSSSK